MTFLNWAFAHLKFESAKALVAQKADPHMETEGSSPFGISMHFDGVRWLKLLVESGADISTKVKGSPAWFSIIYTKNWSHLDYLIDKGVSVNASDKAGNTAIMSMASLEEYEQALKLIDQGADITVVPPGHASFAYDVYSNPVESDHAEYENRERVIKLLEQKRYQLPGAKPERNSRAVGQRRTVILAAASIVVLLQRNFNPAKLLVLRYQLCQAASIRAVPKPLPSLGLRLFHQYLQLGNH